MGAGSRQRDRWLVKTKQNTAASFNEATGDCPSNTHISDRKYKYPHMHTRFSALCTHICTQQEIESWVQYATPTKNLAIQRFSWFAAPLMNSVFTKTCLSQTRLMSLMGQKIKPNIPHVRHVNHSVVSCIYNVTAISEITLWNAGLNTPALHRWNIDLKIQDYTSVK